MWVEDSLDGINNLGGGGTLGRVVIPAFLDEGWEQDTASQTGTLLVHHHSSDELVWGVDFLERILDVLHEPQSEPKAVHIGLLGEDAGAQDLGGSVDGRADSRRALEGFLLEG